MEKKLLFLLFAIFFISSLNAQSYAFGVKGGLTLGLQKWDNFEQDPLFKYHGIAFIESAPEENRFAIFAQLGYHVKGSAIRNRNVINRVNGNVFRLSTREFQFRNISLTVGAKQKYDFNDKKIYYMLGFRGDFTATTNLGEYAAFNERFPASALYPWEAFVRKINYGVTVGGGMEVPFSDYISGVIELTVNPDFSRQYRQLSGGILVFDPRTGNNVALRDRLIVNNTFEITLGLRFLHVIEYIDIIF